MLPLVMGLLGDNTYGNFAEANRAFWRQTVIPLVKRTSASLMHWLEPAFGQGLRLEPDLDAIEALSSEREALWRRIAAAAFLTDDEKRQAVGYGAKGEAALLSAKYREDQLRDERGRFADEGRGDDDRQGNDEKPRPVVLAGGFEPGDMNLTAQQFMSKNCKGIIRAEMPSQFLNLTIAEIIIADRNNVSGARTCLKLLSRDRFMK